MDLRFFANKILFLNFISFAVLLLFVRTITAYKNVPEYERQNFTSFYLSLRVKPVSYSDHLRDNFQNKYFAYRITHRKDQINYVIIAKLNDGIPIFEGILFYIDHDGFMKMVELFSFCLKQGIQGIEVTPFSDPSVCNVAYFQDGVIFVADRKGYLLNRIKDARIVNPAKSAIAVGTELVIMQKIVDLSEGKECSNGGNFENKNFYRKCSEDSVLLQYNGSEPIGIASKMGAISEYLAVFFSREVAIVLDGNYIYCGPHENSCEGMKFKNKKTQKSISFFHYNMGVLPNELWEISSTSELSVYKCKDFRWLYFSFYSSCRNFMIEDNTLYLTASGFQKPVCNFRPYGFMFLNDYEPATAFELNEEFWL